MTFLQDRKVHVQVEGWAAAFFSSPQLSSITLFGDTMVHIIDYRVRLCPPFGV